MADKDATALRKRAQIAKANRIMFIWVAGASVIVSASIVMVVVMVQKGVHNQKAITQLNDTVKVLKQNNNNAEALENSIRKLGSNQALLGLRANESNNALQAILDALPADANPSAFGASLQTKLFPADIEIEGIQVVPSAELVTGTGTEGSEPNTIQFRFIVQGDAVQLKTLLERLERSIRTIQLRRVTIESVGSKQALSVEGEAYYEPAKQLQLKNLDIKP